MAATSYVNGCVFTPTANGIADFVVSAAVTGWQTPALAGAIDGATYRYRAASIDQSQWEDGTGVYTVSSTTLTRATVKASSAANAKVAFTTIPQVTLTFFDDDMVALALLASPAFTGVPTAPNPASGNNSTQIATTSFVAGGTTIFEPGIVYNCGMSFSVASSALTANVKQYDGATDPTAIAPVIVGMRSSTLSSGASNLRKITAATSLVVNSGATLGHANATAGNLHWYLIDNAGTPELAVSTTDFGSAGIITTTAITAGATSATIMYSTTARTGVAFRKIATSIDTQTTAGTWAAVPSSVTINPQAAISDTSYIPGPGLGSNSTMEYVVANNGIIANSSGVFVQANTGIVANSSGVWVDTTKVVQPATTTTISVGYTLTPYNAGTLNTGTFTPVPASGNYQYAASNGAFTFAAPASDCAIDILLTNGTAAGAITFSGYTVSSSFGDPLTTISTNKFIISIRRINSIATYLIKALQ